MNRRSFLKKAGGGAAAAGLGAFVNDAQGESRPVQPVVSPQKRNILLYIVDDQGTGDAGCYGHENIKTPALDALAEDGVLFTHAFCTSASCSASRAVIFSGQHNHSIGHYGHSHCYNHFSTFSDVPTLSKILSENGYRTANAGKYHVAPEEVYPFDTFIPWTSPVEMAELSRKVIQSDSDNPFFLCICTMEPHRPFPRYPEDDVSPDDVVVPDYLPDIPECREELAKYYASVLRGDKGLQRVVEILKETGHYDDTLIIYLSDNGIAFPGAKTTVYDPGVRVPFVVRNPFAQKQGAVTDAMVSFTDITPTVLEFAGIDSEKFNFFGRSFLLALTEPHQPDRDRVYLSHTFHEVTMYYPMRGIRTRQFKFIWNIAHKLDYPFASDLYESKTWQAVLDRGLKIFGKRTIEAYLHRAEFELYDIQKDPHEVDNLADDPTYAEQVELFKTQLKDFQKRTDDPWISKWEYE